MYDIFVWFMIWFMIYDMVYLAFEYLQLTIVTTITDMSVRGSKKRGSVR